MAQFGRRFPTHPVTRARPFGVIPSITLSVSAAGHLTLSGKTLLLNPTAVATKVSFAITQAWNNALYASKTAVSFAVFVYSAGALGTKITEGTTETTDINGLIEIVTTAAGHFIGDTVVVNFWKIGGGPAGEDIIGSSFQQLVAGP